MGWIFDIAVVVLVIIAAVIGAKKGFFRACFDFCGALIAMIAAGLLSSPVAEWIFTTFFRPSLVEKISAAVMGLGAGDAVNTVFDAFPELIQRALEAAGITQGSIMADVYKRQRIRSTRASRLTATPTAALPWTKTAKSSTATSSWPVSYTHLDVYKRQIFGKTLYRL